MSYLEEPRLTAQDKAEITRRAVYSAAFNYMRNHVLIRGNTKWPIENFSMMFERFRTAADPGRGPAMTLLYRQTGGDEETITFLIGGAAYRTGNRELIRSVFSTMSYLVRRHIRSHFIVHAGCVEHKGRGILISGRSGMGKSTLTAHLAARGMGFLSDELAPINRRTGRVDAVPMPIGIRRGAASGFVQGKPALDSNFLGDEKKFIDIGVLNGARPVDSVIPARVLFLTSGTTGRVSTPKKFDRKVRVTVTGTTRCFEREMAETAGWSITGRGETNSFPSFVLEADDPGLLLPRLYRILNAHELELVSLEHEDLDPPDFSARPVLAKIPPSAGIIELVKKIPSFHIGELVRTEFGNKLSLLMAELSSLLREVSFYKLSPGRLEETIECVEELSQ